MSDLIEIKLIDVLKAIKLRAFFLIFCGSLVIVASYALSCLLVGPQTTYKATIDNNLFIITEDDFEKAPNKTFDKQNLNKVEDIIAAKIGVEDEGIKISFDEKIIRLI